MLAGTMTGLRLAVTTGPWWARPIALLRSCAGLVAALAGIACCPFVHGTQRLYHAASERYPGVLRQALAHRGAVAGGGLLLLALTAAGDALAAH